MRQAYPIFIAVSACAIAFGLMRPARGADAVPDSFNYFIGTQTIGSAYQFTDQPRIVETAQAILDMGSNVIKFKMDRNYAQPSEAGRADPTVHCLKDLAASATYKQVLDMPFAYYVIWALPFETGSWRNGLSAPDQEKEYREIYDLSRYLLQAYSGSHKTFYLGHWEGDWMLRGAGQPADAVTPAAIGGMIQWLNIRQKAVEDALRDTPHRDVQVYNYVEVNRVRDAMKGLKSVTNDVLPHTSVDYVSYSSYDSLNGPIDADLPKAMDYIESKLPPKPGIFGKRVFIGEYGFPSKRFSAAEQDEKSRQVMRAAIAWGCPFVLYWEMYNNEVKVGRQVGYWLIDDHGIKQLVYSLHQNYYRWGKQFVATYKQSHRGAEPTDPEFRKAAVDYLDSRMPAAKP